MVRVLEVLAYRIRVQFISFFERSWEVFYKY